MNDTEPSIAAAILNAADAIAAYGKPVSSQRQALELLAYLSERGIQVVRRDSGLRRTPGSFL